jgi:hypothetical protein
LTILKNIKKVIILLIAVSMIMPACAKLRELLTADELYSSSDRLEKKSDFNSSDNVFNILMCSLLFVSLCSFVCAAKGLLDEKDYDRARKKYYINSVRPDGIKRYDILNFLYPKTSLPEKFFPYIYKICMVAMMFFSSYALANPI